MSDAFSDNQFRGTLGNGRNYFVVSNAGVPYQNTSALQNALAAALGQPANTPQPAVTPTYPVDPAPTETATAPAPVEPAPSPTPTTAPTPKPFSLGGWVPPSYFGGSSI